MQLDRVSCLNEQGERLFGGVSLALSAGSTTRVLIEHTGRRTALAQVMGGLRSISSGRVTLDGHALDELSERDVHSRIAYIGPDPFLFSRAITYNLGYALNHSPPATDERTTAERALLDEALAAGNSPDWFDESFGTVWTDFSLLSVDNWPDAVPGLMDVLQVVGATDTVAARSKMEKFDALEWQEKMNRENFNADLLRARAITRDRIVSDQLQHLVSGFDRAGINPWSTYAENILFGVITLDGYNSRLLAGSEEFRDGLRRGGLYDSAVSLGTAAVEALLMLYQNLPTDHELVVRFELDDSDNIDAMGRALDTLAGQCTSQQREQAETQMISVFLNIVPGTFNLVVIPVEIEQRVLNTRELSLEYARTMSLENYRKFDPDAYNPGLSVFDNLIFGRINQREQGAYEQLRKIVDEVVHEVQLHEFLMILFFANSQSGIGGSRLPEFARHRIALARTLLKRPDIIVLHDALLRNSAQERADIMARLRRHLPDAAIVSVTESDENSQFFTAGYILDDAGFRVQQGAQPEPLLTTGDSDQSLLSALEKVTELSALETSQKTLLAMGATGVAVTAGETLYQYGDDSAFVYVLQRGRLELRKRLDDGETVVSLQENRGMAGDLELLAGKPRSTRLVAETDCQLIRLEGQVLIDLLHGNVALSRDFLERLANNVVTSLGAATTAADR